MININLHTHTYRNHHAYGTDRQIIEAAIKAGYREIGFSEHIPLVFEDGTETTHRMYMEDVQSYFTSLTKLREEYKDRIKIHIGFEMEYYEQYFDSQLEWVKKSGAEYLLIGQHFVTPENAGGKHAFKPTDDPEVLKKYVQVLIKAANTGLFTYIAHPDGINFTGPDELYEECMTELILELKRLGLPLELNRTGFYEHRSYPDERFWRLAGKLGAKAVIGIDAHSAKAYTDTETIEAMEVYLREHGVELVAPEIRLLKDVFKEEPKIRKKKKAADSFTTQVQVLSQANMNGFHRLFGGKLMSWMDVVACVTARRHSDQNVTTVAVKGLEFREPAYANDILVITGKVVSVGRTSMTIEINAYVEEKDGICKNINKATFVMVAIDEKGNPVEVPELEK